MTAVEEKDDSVKMAESEPPVNAGSRVEDPPILEEDQSAEKTDHGKEPNEKTDAEAMPAAEDAAAAKSKQADNQVAPGKDVEIIGTTMAGSIGTVEIYLADKERWKVKFRSGTSKNFKADALRVVKQKKEKKEKKRKAVEEPAEATTEVPNSAKSTNGKANGGSSAAFSQEDSSLSGLMERMKRESGKSSSGAEDSASTPASTPASNPFASIELAPEKADEEYANISGTKFYNFAGLKEHFKKLQARVEESDSPNGMVQGADMFFLYHLLMQNPTVMGKLRGPIKGFRYGIDPNFPMTKCFMIVYADGTGESFSLVKTAKLIFHPKDGLIKRQDQDGNDLPARPTKKQKKNQQKGNAPAEAVAKEPEKAQEEVEFFEKSRAETGLKLIKEDAAAAKHPSAADWEYPLMDEDYRCFAGYLACPLPADVVKGFYEKVNKGTTWRQPKDPRSMKPIPRKTAWFVSSGCTCTYGYGGVQVEPQEYPPWMLEIMEAYMPFCGLSDRACWPNSCNLNLYEDGGMSVGWHADDEKLFEGRYNDIRIISVSLGQTRTFELLTMDAEDGERIGHKMKLTNGDICTMEGLTQKYYKHRVGKEAILGPRINLTWRWVTSHKQDCPRHVPKKKT